MHDFNKDWFKVLAIFELLLSDLISYARYIRRKRLVIITRRWRLRAKRDEALLTLTSCSTALFFLDKRDSTL